MKKSLIILVLIFSSFLVWSQSDSVVVEDMTSRLIITKDDGSLEPIYELSEYTSLGFILTKKTPGPIRFCNAGPMSIWINGRFFEKTNGDCQTYVEDDMYLFSKSDTVYISIYSDNGFSSLRVEKVDFRNVPKANKINESDRIVRSYFREFSIVSILFILLFAGFLISRRTNRFNYIITRSLSMKSSSYELADTRFFTEVGILYTMLLSLSLAFLWVYLSKNAQFDGSENQQFLTDFIAKWLQVAGLIFGLILLKWIFTSLCSKLFGFKRINEFQTFDFVNICLLFVSILMIPVLADLILNRSTDGWLDLEFRISFLIMLGAFIVYFLLKFVNHTPHKKLLIISYLCATEIMPVILLIGWFFK